MLISYPHKIEGKTSIVRNSSKNETSNTISKISSAHMKQIGSLNANKPALLGTDANIHKYYNNGRTIVTMGADRISYFYTVRE